MTKQEQFAKHQIDWCKIEAKRQDFRRDVLFARYRKFDVPRSWMTRAELSRLESFSRQQDKISGRMHELLDKIGGRDWRSGAPATYVMTELSYADATTRGQLSKTPPPAYGYTSRDMEAFAA